MAAVSLREVFRSRRLVVIVALGFSAGLPMMLVGPTLAAWATDAGAGVEDVAGLIAVALPYTFKWGWAPLLDRYSLPVLGRRRGWMLLLQVALLLAIAVLGTVDPAHEPDRLWWTAVVVALLSATQDVVIDAYNTERLGPEERVAGASAYVAGYRVAMLVGGALPLLLAAHLSWQTTYQMLAGAMVIGIVATLVADEPPVARVATTFTRAFWRPVALLLGRPGVTVSLAFIATYKIGEQLALAMTMPFLLGPGAFSLAEIGVVYQLFGITGTVLGGVVGAIIVHKVGLRWGLLLFGVGQALTNLCYLAVAAAPSIAALGVAVVVDNTANAMASGAFVAFLMSRCAPEASAAQYALLTSLSSVLARVVGASVAASLIDHGWSTFWLASAALAVPAIVLAFRLRVDEGET